jgi:hypothetical protein
MRYVLAIPPFFKIGSIIAYFNLSGNIPVFSIILQIYVSWDTMYGALSFIIHIEISTYPLELLDVKDLMIFPTSKVDV